MIYSEQEMKKKSRKSSSKKRKKQLLAKRKKKNKILKKACLFAVSIVISLSIVALAIMIRVKIVKMPGYSMMPEIRQGEYLVVSKTSEIKRFDLICMKTPNRLNELSIRRVIGLPNDELYYEDDQLFLNGNGMVERYLNERKSALEGMILTDDFTLENVTGENKVPSKVYFVLGDNRQSAADSRFYGFVSEKNIIGRVDMRLFPLSRFWVY